MTFDKVDLSNEINRMKSMTAEIEKATLAIKTVEGILVSHSVKGIEAEISVDSGVFLGWRLMPVGRNAEGVESKTKKWMLTYRDNEYEKKFGDTKWQFRVKYYKDLPFLLKALNDKFEEELRLADLEEMKDIDYE